MSSKRQGRPVAFFEPLESRLLLSATTIYVSAATGNDSTGTGSASAPYATLQQAADVVQAGDTVDVEAGSYAGFIMGWNAPQSGTASAPITFQAAPGTAAGSVIINSRNYETPDGIDVEAGCNYLNIIGFTIENSDGSMTRAGIRIAQSNDVNIENDNVSGAGDWEIYTSFSDYDLIENNVAADSPDQHGIYVANSADYDQILDNTVYGNVGSGIQLNGDLSQGGTGICSNDVVEGNVIYNNGSDGGASINLDGVQNSTIEDNLIYDAQHTGIALFQEDGAAGPSGDVVAGNTVVMTGGGTAIEVETPAGTNYVFDNIFIGSVSLGSGTASAGNYSATSAPSDLFASSSSYALAATSPALGIGVATLDGQSAPAKDINGNPFASDAGAYQGTSTGSGSTGTGSSGSGSGSTGTGSSGSGSGSTGTGSSGSGSGSTGTGSSGSGSGSTGTGSSGSGSGSTGTGSSGSGSGSTGTGSSGSGSGSTGTGSSGSGSGSTGTGSSGSGSGSSGTGSSGSGSGSTGTGNSGSGSSGGSGNGSGTAPGTGGGSGSGSSSGGHHHSSSFHKFHHQFSFPTARVYKNKSSGSSIS
jgi:hypothetical protein